MPNAAAIGASLATVDRLDHVTDPRPTVESMAVSDDGTIGLTTVRFDEKANELPKSTFGDLKEAVAPARAAGVQVEFGGELPQVAERPTASGARASVCSPQC
jgi:RND superfamily putative drug exporter